MLPIRRVHLFVRFCVWKLTGTGTCTYFKLAPAPRTLSSEIWQDLALGTGAKIQEFGIWDLRRRGWRSCLDCLPRCLPAWYASWFLPGWRFGWLPNGLLARLRVSVRIYSIRSIHLFIWTICPAMAFFIWHFSICRSYLSFGPDLLGRF